MIHCGSPRSPRAQKPAFMQFTCNMCCCEIAECTIHFRLGQCLCRATGDLHARTDHISSRGVTTLALTLYELALVCLVYPQIQPPLSIISIVAEPVTARAVKRQMLGDNSPITSYHDMAVSWRSFVSCNSLLNSTAGTPYPRTAEVREAGGEPETVGRAGSADQLRGHPTIP